MVRRAPVIRPGSSPTEAEGKHQGYALDGKADDDDVQQHGILLNAKHGIRKGVGGWGKLPPAVFHSS